MAVNKLQLKRSAVAGKEPTTSSLALGELAINTYEGKVFLKKDDGVETIVQLADVSGSIFSASYAQTSSHSDNFTVNGAVNVYGSQYISGSLVVGNDITARRLVVQTITSSVIYSSGSNVFGDATSDTQTFTGSVNISGSLNLVGNQTINSGYELTVDDINVNTIRDRSGGTLALTANTSSVSGFLTVNNSISASGKIEAVSFTGSFSGSINNLQGTATHIPYFSSSQVLANSAIYQASSESIAINQNGVTTAAPEALYVWQPNTDSFNVISGKGNSDNYLQLNIQNTNQGVSASSDVVATANNGDENNNYINMGINGENFNGPIGEGNDAYLYSTGNNLHIGNTKAGKHLGFFVGGDNADTDKKLQLNPTGHHQMTGSLDIDSQVTASRFVTRGATAAQFVKGDGSLDSTLYTSASVFNNTTSSLQAFSASMLAFTASTLVNSASFDTRINYISSSFNASTASFNAYSASMNAFSASMLSFTASQKNSNGTFATTGSNVFRGNQTITGSLSVSGSTNIYGTTNITGSVNVSGSTGTAITANVDTIVFTGSYAQSGSVNLSSSVDIVGSLTVNGRNYINDSASFDTRINYISSSFNASTASINSFTASINAFSASMLTTTASINAFSSSVLNFTASTLVNSASFDTRINYISSSFEAATASLNLFSASMLSTTASVNAFSASMLSFTSSTLVNSASFDTRINYISSSFNAFSASILDTTASLNAFSASVLNFTASTLVNSASFDTRINYISSSFEAATASLNLFSASVLSYTASNNEVVAKLYAETSSLLANTASMNLFSASMLSYTASTNATIADILIETASLQAFTQSMQNFTASTLINSASFDTRINYLSSSFEANSASLNLFTASFNAFSSSILNTTASINTFSASILSFTASQKDLNGTLATTGSNTFIGNQVISGSTSMTGSLSLTGSQNIIGNLTVTDTITAQRLVVQFITSSVAQVTGSTKFGDEVTDTHQFTGSVSISGSLAVNGRDYITESGSFDKRINYISSSFEAATASLNLFSASILSYTASNNEFVADMLAETASLQAATASLNAFSSSILSYTASNNEFVADILTETASLQAATASLNLFSASVLSFTASTLINSASFDTRIQYVSTSFEAHTASFNNFSSSILSTTASINNFSASVLNFTASTLVNSASFDTRINYISSSFEAATASLNAFSASILSYTSSNNAAIADILVETASLQAATASLNLFSASMLSFTASQKNLNGTFATTGSNTFIGNQTISGSIILENGAVIKDNDNNSISFGYQAAETNQGTQSIAIGNGAGNFNQSHGSVAVGANAGSLTQGLRAVALGALAGANTQGQDTIAIGTQAGGTNQGEYSIALGYWAGRTNQASHSIVINATGNDLDNTITSSLVIAPIRNTNGDDGVLQYNTTTKEVSYATTLNGITNLATTGSNVFIGNQTVTGSLFTSGSNTLVGSTTLTGSLNITGSTTQVGNNILLGNTTLSGSIIISGSVGAQADFSVGGTMRLDPAQDPGPTNITASYLFTSASNTATGYDLYYRQDDNLVKFKWLEGGLSTGLLYGGAITYSGSTIFIKPGTGIINNMNASTGSEISPIITYVNWGPYTASATYLTSSQNTYLYVDASGNIFQQTSFFNQTQYEQAIPLGRVTHPNFSSITGVGSNVQTTYDSDTQQNDFIRAFGPIKVSGFSINAHTGSLGLGIGDGIAYNLGGFYSQDPNSPSHYESNGFATASIARAWRSGSGVYLDNNGGAFYNAVDPDYWDDGTGTLNTMSAGDWQIQRVFANPVTGRVVVYYGQNTYTTLLNALQYLATDSFTEGEFTAKSLVFVGYLVLKGQTNNLTDTVNNRIINAGIFRNIAGGSAGGSAVVQRLENLADVIVTTPSNGQALVYDGGNWINSIPLSSSYALSASYSATATSSSYAVTASSADNFLVRGTLTAQNIVVQTISSSVDYVSGSTKFGTLSSNTHEFTGSVSISGSLAVTAGVVNSLTSSYAVNADLLDGLDSSTFVLTGSFGAQTASFNAFSASVLAYTASNNTTISQLYAETASILSYTASAKIDSGSVSTRLVNLEAFSSSLDNTFATDADLNALSSSFIAYTSSLNNFSASILSFTASTLTNSASFDTRINYVSSSFESATASLNNFSASILNYTASNNAAIADILIETASLQGATGSLFNFSASILSYTASNNTTISQLYAETASILAHTASINAFSASINAYTSSNNDAITSLYNATASLNTFSASVLNYTASNNATISQLYAETSSLLAFSASMLSFTASQKNSNGTFATTGSNIFEGLQTINNNLVVTGSITAQTLIVQTITSSVDFVTGSTHFGTILENTHQFTGSVSVSGSLAINDSNVILTNQTASMSVATASYWSGSINNVLSASYAITATTASILKNTSATVSSSTAVYTTGTSLLYDLSAFKGAMVDYVVSTSGSGDSIRGGTFTAVWNAVSSSTNEVTTMDIGNTDAVQFTADATGSVFVNVATGSWVIDSLYRGLGTAIVASAPSITYSIGDSALGGIVAYILQPGDSGYDAGVQHGLVATVADVSTGADWGGFFVNVPGATGTAIGTGNQNTLDILAADTEPGIAAKLCYDLTEGGYSDWYLPSIDELNVLYTNRVAIGGFDTSPYWSSTKYQTTSFPFTAKFLNFDDAGIGNADTNQSYRVRAIRSF